MFELLFPKEYKERLNIVKYSLPLVFQKECKKQYLKVNYPGQNLTIKNKLCLCKINLLFERSVLLVRIIMGKSDSGSLYIYKKNIQYLMKRICLGYWHTAIAGRLFNQANFIRT